MRLRAKPRHFGTRQNICGYFYISKKCQSAFRLVWGVAARAERPKEKKKKVFFPLSVILGSVSHYVSRWTRMCKGAAVQRGGCGGAGTWKGG